MKKLGLLIGLLVFSASLSANAFNDQTIQNLIKKTIGKNSSKLFEGISLKNNGEKCFVEIEARRGDDKNPAAFGVQAYLASDQKKEEAPSFSLSADNKAESLKKYVDQDKRLLVEIDRKDDDKAFLTVSTETLFIQSKLLKPVESVTVENRIYSLFGLIVEQITLECVDLKAK